MTDTEFWNRFWDVVNNGDFEHGVIATTLTVDDVFEKTGYPDDDPCFTDTEAIYILRKTLNWRRSYLCPLSDELLWGAIENFHECKAKQGEKFDPAQWASV